mgnify:FL=1
MKILNWYGLLFVAVILIPNIVFAATNTDGFENKFSNKKLEVLEQIGRFSCFAFMFLCIPKLSRGWLFDGAKNAYLIIGAVLVGLYVLGWIVFWNESSVCKALVLSILPSLLFLESGILTRNYLLLAGALIFAPCHIAISYMNAVL